MKKLVSLLAILVVLLVGVPYIFGQQAESQYRKYITLISQNSSIPIKVDSYSRGIWSSKATISIPVGTSQVKFHQQILHGPLTFNRVNGDPKGFEWGRAVVMTAPNLMQTPYSETHEAFGTEDPISAKTIFEFNGTVKNYIHSPAMQYTAKNGATVNWQGLEGEFTTDKFLNVIKGNMTLPGLMAKGPSFDGEIQGVNLEIDQKRSESNLWVGKGILTIDSIMVNDTDKGFQITSVKFDGESSEQNKLFNVFWTFDLSRLTMPSGNYGPMEVLVRLLNMDTEVIRSLQELPNTAGQNKDIPKPLIRKLLEKTPTLVIENSKMTLPEGDVVVNAKFSIGGSQIPETFDESIYLKTLNGDVDVLLPKSLLEKAVTQQVTMTLSQDPQYLSMLPENQKTELERQTVQKIDKYKSEGLVTEKGNEYSVKFTVKDGKIMVNGKEVPL